jgi:putative membrane protein
MMDWADSGLSWWWMLPMMMFMVLLIGAVFWALLAMTRPAGSPPEVKRPTADDILKERFVRGEIDASEYQERFAGLHATSSDNRVVNRTP